MMLSQHRHGLFADCLAQQRRALARSAHFTLYSLAAQDSASDEPVIVHRFSAAQIDNNLGYYVATELLPLLKACHERGLDGYAGYSEQEIFERSVGDIVRSMDSHERRAWHRFYDNTLEGLARAAPASAPAETADFIAHFRAIYRQAIDLIDSLRGSSELPSVLDMATCFGFFPLLLARHWQGKAAMVNILGCDLNAALVDFANGYARQRQAAQVARFAVADVLAEDIQQRLAPLPASFDVVTALHLLEHLSARQTERAVANLWRLTRQRLIIAVPLEEKPDPRFGHQQVFDQARLSAIGRALSGDYRYFEHHGGWLVVDRRD